MACYLPTISLIKGSPEIKVKVGTLSREGVRSQAKICINSVVELLVNVGGCSQWAASWL